MYTKLKVDHPDRCSRLSAFTRFFETAHFHNFSQGLGEKRQTWRKCVSFCNKQIIWITRNHVYINIHGFQLQVGARNTEHARMPHFGTWVSVYSLKNYCSAKGLWVVYTFFCCPVSFGTAVVILGLITCPYNVSNSTSLNEIRSGTVKKKEFQGERKKTQEILFSLLLQNQSIKHHYQGGVPSTLCSTILHPCLGHLQY